MYLDILLNTVWILLCEDGGGKQCKKGDLWINNGVPTGER